MSLEKHIKKNKKAFKDHKMPDTARTDFEALLKSELHQSEKKNTKVIRMRFFSIAASLAIIVSMGYLYVSSINKANEDREQLIYSMNDETASERIKAIYNFEEAYKKEDDRLIKTLYKLLHTDSNNNVKIAAIDALLKFPQNQEMRKQLISALEKEEEPLVQIKLIQSLTVLREQRAKEPIQEILDDEQTLPVVKGNASLAIAKLEN